MSSRSVSGHLKVESGSSPDPSRVIQDQIILFIFHTSLEESEPKSIDSEIESSEDEADIEVPSESASDPQQSDQDLPEVISDADEDDATTEDSEIDGGDNDDVVWSFSSPEERVVKEDRPVIGSTS